MQPRVSLPMLVWAMALVQCSRSAVPSDSTEHRESPQASAQPAVLAQGPSPNATSLEGTHAVPFRGDEELAVDSLAKEVLGMSLSVTLRVVDGQGAAKPLEVRGSEVSFAGVDAARRATEHRVTLDISPSRLRMVMRGRGWAVPPDTEVRSRTDRLGSIVVWPGGSAYRPLAPGAMRALLGERRFDVTPLVASEVLASDDSGRRLGGVRARKVELKAPLATISMELGRFDGLGEGGTLFCRWLCELGATVPPAGACGLDELPVRTEIRWHRSRATLLVEAAGAVRKSDLSGALLAVPPPSVMLDRTPLPTMGLGPMLTSAELGALRLVDVDAVSPAGAPVPGASLPSPWAKDGLWASNTTDQLMLLMVDGAAAAWVAPGDSGELKGLRKGRYAAQWRSFLGDIYESAWIASVPGTAQLGRGADAGR